MSAIAERLLEVVEQEYPRLLEVPEAASARRPAPGKWSPREIIGHLIDSAANNHGRFVRAQLADDLVFPGYAQDDWVRLQGYADTPWPELVGFWRMYNRHVARVMARVAPAVGERARARHNLPELAWRPWDPNAPATLDALMADYVAHLEHHLAQVWAAVDV